MLVAARGETGQRGQVEERETVGGRIRKVWTTSLFDGLPTQFLVGGDWRSDALDVNTGPSVARTFTARTLDLDLSQHNLAAYAQVQVKPAPWLKLTGGARCSSIRSKRKGCGSPGRDWRTAPASRRA
jgi:outer membrane receptor protein involved in Fe transport